MAEQHAMKTFWASGNTGDGGDAVMTIRLMQDQVWPTGLMFYEPKESRGSRFDDKDEVGCQSVSFVLHGARPIVLPFSMAASFRTIA